jgi:membrane-bound serine protease (ClpP class)
MHHTTEQERRMNIRAEILGILSDPTTSYLVFLGGVALVIVEFIRPGRVVPGTTGAVAITVALYRLMQWSWTVYGTALLAASVVVALSSIRTASFIGPAVSGALYTGGSYLLISGNEKINPAATLVGGTLAFTLAWLLQLALRARLAKCHR